MASIKYDTTELVNATYVPRRTNHESAPERIIDSMKLARQDGEAVIDDVLDKKFITIEGILIGSSQSDLETKIDSFKELIYRKDKNLDIDFAGGTRRYVCRAVSLDFDRDHFNLTHVPYKIVFLVPSGIGKDTSETTAQDQNNIVATSTAKVVAFTGSYDPKPRHKIIVNTRGNADVVRITNTDTSEYIEVDLDGFSGADYLEIDQENKTVKKNGTTNLEYRGKFPTAIIGNNNYTLDVYGSGYTLDQEQTVNDGSLRSVLYSNTTPDRLPQQAQSFKLSQSGRVGKISCYIDKDGAPTGKMQWHFRDDSNNSPDMTASGRVSGNGSNGTEEYEIAAASVPASGAFTEASNVNAHSAAAFLKAGVRYWLFLNPGVVSGTTSSDFYCWYYSNIPTRYVDGKAMANRISGQAYVDGVGNAQAGDGVDEGQFDYMFRIYRGDGNSPSFDLRWQIYYTKKYL